MARLSSDLPDILKMVIERVDYSKINSEHYDNWLLIIRDNIGKHLKLRQGRAELVEVPFPIRQDLCDLVNGFDFSSINKLQQMALVPLVKNWANSNLPLKTKI